MKTVTLLRFLVGVLALVMAAPATVAASAYPDRYITLIVPVPPGGAGDYIGRLVAGKLSDLLGQKVIVDNRGGAAGMIASTATMRAAPDGYTLLLSSSTSHGTAPVAYKSIAYHPINDFTHIGLVGVVPAVITVNAELPAQSLKELVAAAAAKPGELNYGSSGNGSPLHFWGEMFKSAAGVSLTHVPYKGAGPAMLDLVAGRIHVMLDGLPSQIANIQGGKIRPLAAMSASRSAKLPDLPTTAEAGYPGLEGGLWFGLSGPRGLPAPVLERLSAELAKVVAMPDVRASLENFGIIPTLKSSPDYARFIGEENAKYGKIARDAKIALD